MHTPTLVRRLAAYMLGHAIMTNACTSPGSRAITSSFGADRGLPYIGDDGTRSR